MRLTAGAHTDAGLRKRVNQDAFGARIVASGSYEAALLVACDGVGGMSEGELASGAVVCAFLDWFGAHMAELVLGSLSEADILAQWQRLAREVNACVYRCARSKGARIGTTATVLLGTPERVMVMNVGDTRLYLADRERLTLLTKDHTLVQREVDRGLLTPEAARTDRRRNILVRCIGAEQTVAPDYYTSALRSGCVYLLCTDGLRNVLEPRELYEGVRPERLEGGERASDLLRSLVETAKHRGERDNITALLLHANGAPPPPERTVDLEDTLKLCFSKVAVQEEAKTLWRDWREKQGVPWQRGAKL